MVILQTFSEVFQPITGHTCYVSKANVVTHMRNGLFVQIYNKPAQKMAVLCGKALFVHIKAQSD